MKTIWVALLLALLMFDIAWGQLKGPGWSTSVKPVSMMSYYPPQRVEIHGSAIEWTLCAPSRKCLPMMSVIALVDEHGH